MLKKKKKRCYSQRKWKVSREEPICIHYTDGRSVSDKTHAEAKANNAEWESGREKKGWKRQKAHILASVTLHCLL